MSRAALTMQKGSSKNKGYSEGNKILAPKTRYRLEWETVTAVCFDMTLIGTCNKNWTLTLKYRKAKEK